MSSDLGSDALLIEVREDANLTSADREVIERRLHEEWPPESDPYQWAPLPWFVLARRGGELVGMVSVLERTVTVAGQPIRIAGIGNVVTAPSWRKRGIATALMQRAQALSFDELGASFGLLLCESDLIPFYEQVGWQWVAGPLVFDQPAGKVTWKDQTMVLTPGGETWPGGVIDLCGLPF